MTEEASGNIWVPTVIFSNTPLSAQTIVDQQVGDGISGAIFTAGGSGNILDNIYSRRVVEYLEEFLQVGGGIFWGIFSAGGWRTCCRWRPLHNWLQPCDRPSSNHSSVCTVRTPQNQALYTYLQNRANILVISVR